ncbi:hypothetical protein V8B97DRAFT_1919817 [Scleroderma yunnanense]
MDIKVVVYWVMCCIISHNMIIRFEEEMGNTIEPSSVWAVEEGMNQQDGDMDTVAEAVGTPSQFWMKLLEQLFWYLGFVHAESIQKRCKKDVKSKHCYDLQVKITIIQKSANTQAPHDQS